jgi:hypothetical protein
MNRLKSSLRLLGAVGIAIALSIAVAAPASASTSPSAVTSVPSSRYNDFDAPVVTSVGAAQCTKAVAARTGAWACPDSATPTAPGIQPNLAASPPAFSGTDWNLIDSTHAEFYGTFIWGYGSTQFGGGTNYIKWTLNGSTMTENPVRFQVARATTKSVFSGELFNGAANVPHGGSPLKACTQGSVGIQGGGITRAWPNGGCALQDSSNYDHNMVGEMSWYTNGYPGDWWVYARSPVAHAADKANFRFTSASTRPGDAANSGYDS